MTIGRLRKRAAPRERAPKLGERIASQIADRLVSDKLPVGAPLGTEADLHAQFGSSRCTIREAIAILERDGFVQVRRGRGGGLFVAPTDMYGLRYAMRAYFEYLEVDYDELFLARRVINSLAIRLASERIEREDIANLRMPGIRFWAILKATHNPIVEILGVSAGRYELLNLARSRISAAEYFDFLSRNVKLLEVQAEVIIGGNLRSALNIQEEIFDIGEDFAKQMFNEQRDLSHAEFLDRINSLISPRRPLKKPEIVTYSLVNDIINTRWEVGHHLGSEPELISRLGVGRSVFREAVRPLEQYGIVEMRTGRHSGLKVAAPSLAGVGREFARRFDMLELPLAHYTEAYDAIGAAIVALASRSKAAAEPVPAVSGASEGRTSDSSRLNAVLGGGAGNRILAAMLQILTQKVGEVEEGLPSVATVLAAIQARDPALAHRSFMLLRRDRPSL